MQIHILTIKKNIIENRYETDIKKYKCEYTKNRNSVENYFTAIIIALIIH